MRVGYTPAGIVTLYTPQRLDHTGIAALIKYFKGCTSTEGIGWWAPEGQFMNEPVITHVFVFDLDRTREDVELELIKFARVFLHNNPKEVEVMATMMVAGHIKRYSFTR